MNRRGFIASVAALFAAPMLPAVVSAAAPEVVGVDLAPVWKDWTDFSIWEKDQRGEWKLVPAGRYHEVWDRMGVLR